MKGCFYYQKIPTSHVFAENTTNIFPKMTLLIAGLILCLDINVFSQVVTPVDCDFVVAQSIQDVKCFGESAGRIALSVSNASGNVTYQWLNPIGVVDATAASIENQPADTYHVIVSDNICSDTFSFVINQPPPLLLTARDTTICDGGGTINLNSLVDASGGVGDFTRTFTTLAGAVVDCATCPLAIDINENTLVRATLQDGNACLTTQNISISVVEPIALEIDLQNETCGQDGQISVSANGGSGDFAFRILGLPDTQNNNGNFEGLTGGQNYTIGVLDGTGCTAVKEVFLPVTTLPEATPFVTNATCVNEQNGAIELVTNDFGAVVGYALNNPQHLQDAPLFEGLEAGAYTLFVADTFGCVTRLPEQVIVGEPDSIQAELSLGNVSCPGEGDGSAALSVSGGNGGFLFSLDNMIFQNSNLFTGLDGGPHFVVIKDALGCESTQTFLIEEEEAPDLEAKVTPSCPGSEPGTGSIVILDSGKFFVGAFEYSIDSANFQSSNVFDSLPPGMYEVFVVDVLTNCLFTLTVEVPQANPPGVSFDTQAVSCPGSADGSVTVNITSGGTSGNFEYSLDGIDFAPVNTFSDLAAGLYDLFIRDSVGCVFQFQFQITGPSPTLIQLNGQDLLCNGSSKGQITTKASGGNPPYQYALDNPINFQTDSVFTELTAKEYTIFVQDANGCLDSASLTLKEPAEIQIDFSFENETCSESNGLIAGFVTGGIAPFNFKWNNGASSPLITNLPMGIYQLTVTDANNCSKTGSQEIMDEATPILTASLMDVSCWGKGDGEINLTITGGKMPFEIEWSNGAISEDISGLNGGSFSVTVLDDNGCLAESGDMVVQEPERIVLDDSIWFDNNFGFIDLRVHGGVSPYFYLWSTGAISEDVGGLPAPATYAVTVTDATGCLESETIDLVITGTSQPLPESSVSVFPIPVFDELRVRFDLPENQSVVLELIDLKGSLVQSFPPFLAKNDSLHLAVGNLPAGIYFLKIKLNGKILVRKVVKQ